MSFREEKRKRAKNFSAEEELVLTMLADEKRNVLGLRKSDAITWRRKMQAWKDVADLHFQQTGVRREWKALREKYVNIRRRSEGKPIGSNKTLRLYSSLEPSMRRDEAPTRIINKALDSDASSDIDNDMSYVEKDELLADTTESAREEDLIATRTEWLSGNIRTQSLPKSCNRNLEEETINLIRLQQDFFRSKNQRAQEKHDLEMRREKWKLEQEVQEGKLRIEMIELEIMEKRAKLDMK
ncbi:uncharacterized protein LOC132793473 isoform X2 [Drosophila nasuta]|uniref:uncharacterized protein LOC132793473 isoform X2 n=1 Tax=Drosophila nasuta TaxID=42062 RepID=UPI00295EC576|nr:uncharacterized protein LOC132793473 isoform X2 [Drosophila nasuta]